MTKFDTPDILDKKQSIGDGYMLSFFRIQHIKSDGMTNWGEFTPLLFKNNQLIA